MLPDLIKFLPGPPVATFAAFAVVYLVAAVICAFRRDHRTLAATAFVMSTLVLATVWWTHVSGNTSVYHAADVAFYSSLTLLVVVAFAIVMALVDTDPRRTLSPKLLDYIVVSEIAFMVGMYYLSRFAAVVAITTLHTLYVYGQWVFVATILIGTIVVFRSYTKKGWLQVTVAQDGPRHGPVSFIPGSGLPAAQPPQDY